MSGPAAPGAKADLVALGVGQRAAAAEVVAADELSTSREGGVDPWLQLGWVDPYVGMPALPGFLTAGGLEPDQWKHPALVDIEGAWLAQG